MRLDIFLPFLRKTKKGAAPPTDGFLLRTAKKVLPASWFADRVTGKPGLIRRTLKRVGPTVLSSPVRRLSQTVCFLLFLWLFFYVCWPYSALPKESLLSQGWSTLGPDQETGLLEFTRETPQTERLAEHERVHIVDEGADTPTAGHLAEFEVVSFADESASLKPLAPLTAEQLDRLLLSSGPWAMHNAHPWPAHYTNELASKEFISAESFLIIDPLVAISTAIAARSWVWSLTFAGVILVVCVLVPRGFCGYLCPLGTLIDLFDWLIGRRVTWLRVPDDGPWVHIKYYLLAGTLVASVCGVLVSGFVAAIPIITRGMLFIAEPLQTGLLRDWGQVPPMNWGHFLSIGLFFGVLGLGLLKPRFWCKYVCPSGAVFSLGNLFRASERKVEDTCINCNKCVEICPFDAIKPDFTTRTSDCTLCQTCGGVCPTHAIKFVDRWDFVDLKLKNDPPTHETPLGRRGFLSLAAGTAAAVVGGVGVSLTTRALGAPADASPPVRPPGSVPEPEFLDMCIRCGECFKVCPYNVLQATGFEHGLESLWTPRVNAEWAGCDSSCNACGQVCPTGAIRALPLEEKRVARMGLAIVEETCLPVAGREACDFCIQECNRAGYEAIETMRVGTQVDEQGQPIEGSGFLVPVVLADKCVGCGLCQQRCAQENVRIKPKLKSSAIVVEAGPGKEDRLMRGSYRELRAAEKKKRGSKRQQDRPPDTFYIPGETPDPTPTDDPFGVTDPITPPSDGANPFFPAETPDAPSPPIDTADPFGLGESP